MKKIVISVGNVVLAGELNDSDTAEEIWAQLPIQTEASVWGDEIYFEIPVQAEQAADAHADVEVGTLGYWPVGHALCIFYGPTPSSTGAKPRAYSPVNIIGHVTDDATKLRGTAHGIAVRVARAKGE